MGINVLDLFEDTASAAEQEQLRDAYSRLRWNASVLGLLAHRMDAIPGDPAIAAAPTDAGAHLRWRFDPLRGWPADGFYIYRRPARGHWMPPVRRVDFRERNSGPSVQLVVPFFPPKSLRLTHNSGVRIVGGTGLLVSDASSSLHIHFPVSVHAVAVFFAGVGSPVIVQGYHGGELMFHAAAAADDTLEPIRCPEMVDEIRVIAADTVISGLEAIPVYQDRVGWEPIGRVPRLGTSPYDHATIVSRLGPDEDGTPVDERENQIAGIVNAIRNGATAGPVSWVESEAPRLSEYSVEAPVLVDMMSLRPRVARVFGLYAIDPDPLETPADYMVVGAWCNPSSMGARGIALFEDGEEPPARDGLPLRDLVARLIGRPGLLYCAPVFHVTRERALAPLAAATPSVNVGEEVRRQLDPAGNALIELQLTSWWTLSIPAIPDPPPLARQLPSLASVELTIGANLLGEELGPPHVAELGVRVCTDVVSIPVANLPTTVSVRVESVDVFGLRSASVHSVATALLEDLYPTAPPPAAFTGALARAGAGVELHTSWVWGGRSALFHPGVHGFSIEWLEDLDLPAGQPVRAALNASSAWRTLPLLAPLPALDVTIDSRDTVMTVAAQNAQLVHVEKKGSTLGPLYAGVQATLNLAEPASGRLNDWMIVVGGQRFTITHHTIGDDVWIFFKLDGDSAEGTPFDSIAIDGDAVNFVQNVDLEPIASDLTTSVITASGTAQALAALGPGALLTQVIDVFGVLGRSSDPTEQAIVSTAFKAQEPGDATVVRILPALDVAKVAGVQKEVLALAPTAPTRDRPVRRVFVRARTKDHLGRLGLPSTPFETIWSAAFPPVPAAGPVVEWGSPSDALGQCRLVVSFNLTLQHCGAILHRASDAQIRTTWERWRARAGAIAEADRWTLFGLAGGFVWPGGGIAAPVDVTDPLANFAALPDSMRIFINTLRARKTTGPADAPGLRVFDEAFDRRGKMWRAADLTAFVAPADGDRFEFLDVGERIANKYFYRATLLDAVEREGEPSGVSLPGQGLNIAAPEAPALLAPSITGNEMVVRWASYEDSRITRYRVTKRVLTEAAGPDEVVGGAVAPFAAPMRVEAGRVSLPNYPPSGVTLLGLEDADGNSLFTQGRALAKEGSFLFWYADGNRAAIDVTEADESTHRVTSYVAPLRVTGGVVDTTSWPMLAAMGATLSRADGAGDVTGLGTWRGTSFLTAMRLEEGSEVVLQLTTTAKVDGTFVRRSIGRCPGTPTEATIAVQHGVIDLTGKLNDGDRVTGVFLASDVTLPAGDGTPDPERSEAKTLMSQIKSYQAGFVRRLRENVPVVLMFTPLSEAAPRFVGHTRPLVFSGGRTSVPPWSETAETLTGVFERSALLIADGVMSGTDTATNLLYQTVTEPEFGRIQMVLPDGSDVVAVSADGALEVRGRDEPLVWTHGELWLEGLLAGEGSAASHLYDAALADDGSVTVSTANDRLGDVTLNEARDTFTVVDPLAEGLRITAQYRVMEGDPPVARDVAVTADPRFREQAFVIGAADVGRRWEVTVQAFCDFPAPVGEVMSPTSTTIIEVPPPVGAGVTIDSAIWLETGELEVTYTGSAGMLYRVVAESGAGRVYVLADNTGETRVATSVDVDDVPMPATESFSVTVIARYPNDNVRVFRSQKEV